LEANALKTSRNAATMIPATASSQPQDAADKAGESAAQPQLFALLQRLDSALGVDGRLL
jgi:hypothetical protein